MNIPVLLHPPKTGGTSIHNALIELYGLHNVPMEQTQRILPIEESLAMHHYYHDFNLPENYPAVITVRNPYTRIWSLFRHRLRQRENLANQTPDDSTLSVWYRRFLKSKYRRNSPWNKLDILPCASWMCPQVQHIIRYENFAHDVQQAYGFDINSFEHVLNTGAVSCVSSVSKFYTQGHLDIVNYICEEDFELFGYKYFAHIDDLHSHETN